MFRLTMTIVPTNGDAFWMRLRLDTPIVIAAITMLAIIAETKTKILIFNILKNVDFSETSLSIVTTPDVVRALITIVMIYINASARVGKTRLGICVLPVTTGMWMKAVAPHTME